MEKSTSRLLAYAILAPSGLFLLLDPGTISSKLPPPALPPVTNEVTHGDAKLSYEHNDMFQRVQVSGLVTIALKYPKTVSPNNSIEVDADITLKSLTVGDKHFEPPFPKMTPISSEQNIVGEGAYIFERMLSDGSLSLSLHLAGAEVQPKEYSPIVNGHARWSVKPLAEGDLQGFVSSILTATAAGKPDEQRSGPVGKITAEGTNQIEIRARRTPVEYSRDLSIQFFGALLTLPGIISFFNDIRKRREEREEKKKKEAEAADKKRKEEEEEAEKTKRQKHNHGRRKLPD